LLFVIYLTFTDEDCTNFYFVYGFHIGIGRAAADMRSLCRILGVTYNVYGRYEKFMQSFRWDL